MYPRLGLCFLILNCFDLSAQNSRNSALVGTGYRIPANVITAAPGQLSLISLSGPAAKSGLPIKANAGPTGYPRELGGLQIRITPASGTPVVPQIIAVQQSGCLATATNCSPVTTITTLFPADLAVGLTGTLTVLDGLTTAGEFPFRTVSDNLHFLNSCDSTLIWVGLFTMAPNANACLPNIMQNSALVNTGNPLRPGGGVAAYLYGGGATVLRNDEFKREETMQSFEVHFDYRPNAPGARPTPGVSLTGKPFLSVGFPGGLYQVNFMIPPIPDGVRLPLCDGATIRSNLTITISGANSMDSASFCVEP